MHANKGWMMTWEMIIKCLQSILSLKSLHSLPVYVLPYIFECHSHMSSHFGHFIFTHNKVLLAECFHSTNINYKNYVELFLRLLIFSTLSSFNSKSHVFPLLFETWFPPKIKKSFPNTKSLNACQTKMNSIVSALCKHLLIHI